jgi:hypothetical protein
MYHFPQKFGGKTLGEIYNPWLTAKPLNKPLLNTIFTTFRQNYWRINTPNKGNGSI